MSTIRCVRFVVFGAVAVAAAWSMSSPVAAHTGFESSSPAHGDVVDAVVSEIVIRFTGEATPVGDGFTVLDPDGVVRSPSSTTTEDDKVFLLRFEPPLAGGAVGVRWMVQAPDAHPIDGAFSFTVSAPVATTVAPSTTTPATTAVLASTTAPATTAPATTAVLASTTAPPTTEDPVAESAGQSTSASTPPAGGGDDSGEGVSLEDFLAAQPSVPGEGRQLVGRVISYLGVVGAVGGLAFLALTMRGTRREIDRLLGAVAALGVLTAVGAAIEYWGWLAQAGGSLLGELTSSPGLAMVLRFAGGVVIAGSIIATAITPNSSRRVQPARSLSASAASDTASADPDLSEMQRWSPRAAPLASVGVALVVASFWFDGHTTSEGPRVVHAFVNSVHVAAAAVWAGGVAALAGVLVGRHRREVPGRAAELVVRFSSIATVALASVALAGAVMAVFVLDSPGELTSTEWGRVLLLKTGAVALAALGGAYNHFGLRPALEAASDDVGLEAKLRSMLIAEAIVLTFVVVVTAWLVGSAT